MNSKEARLAFERHATSKIRSVEDLGSITTLGFRGEALPSIAAVAKVVLRTREPTAETATEVRVEGGTHGGTREVGGPPGTAVEVHDLFYNTPARKKFLKSVQSEAAHCTDAVIRSALAHPEVSFRLWRDGKLAKELPRVSGVDLRAREILGGEDLYAAQGGSDGVRVTAYLGGPERARAGAGALYTFVNGRPVRDRALLRAIATAYGSVLQHGRYPAGVVLLEMDPRAVDVNVHPQKSEVRFAHHRAVYGATTRVVADAVRRAPWAGGRPLQAYALEGTSGASWASRATASWTTAAGSSPTGSRAAEPVLGYARSSGAESASPAPPFATPTGAYGSLRVLGQAHAMLIVCEGPDDLVIVDQHAAAERVTFHRLREAHRRRAVPTQRLLFAERVELGAAQAALVDEHQADLGALGIEVEALGGQSFAIHAVPSALTTNDPRSLLENLVAELGREATRPFSAAVDDLLATIACHGSIRAGDRLSVEECRALVASLDGVDFSGNCPHGRPVLVRIPFGELERQLRRR